jgi:hypothetical protein
MAAGGDAMPHERGSAWKMDTEALFRILNVMQDPADGSLSATEASLQAAGNWAEYQFQRPVVIGKPVAQVPVLAAPDLWKISRHGIHFAIESALGGFLDVPDDVDQDIALQVYGPGNGDTTNEQWDFSITTANPEVFEIYCQGNARGKVITVGQPDAGGTAPAMISLDAHVSTSQFWMLDIVSEGPVRIVDVLTGKVLDGRVAGFPGDAGKGGLSDYNGDASQKWWLVPSQYGPPGEGQVMIVNTASCRALQPVGLREQAPVVTHLLSINFVAGLSEQALAEQAWWISPKGNGNSGIRTLDGTFALDVSGDRLQIDDYTGGQERQWVLVLA